MRAPDDRFRRRTRRGATRWLGLALLSVFAALPSSARADPVRGRGEAKGSEWKQPPDAKIVRDRALRRARTEAIKSALSQLDGVDPAARKEVLSSHSSWTSAYRIVSETRSGDAVSIEIEVDVDVARLTKRVAAAGPHASVRPRFSLGAVKASADGSCGDGAALHARIAEELTTLGALAPRQTTGTTPVDILVSCEALGPVRMTHMQAARVEVTAATETAAVATATREAFADLSEQAVASGLSSALFAVSARLSAHQRGRAIVRIEAAGPGDRVRRFEQAVKDKVLGVDRVAVSGLEPGVIRLALDTELSVETLAKRLGTLRLPDFSVTILGIEEPDVVTISLR